MFIWLWVVHTFSELRRQSYVLERADLYLVPHGSSSSLRETKHTMSVADQQRSSSSPSPSSSSSPSGVPPLPSTAAAGSNHIANTSTTTAPTNTLTTTPPPPPPPPVACSSSNSNSNSAGIGGAGGAGGGVTASSSSSAGPCRRSTRNSISRSQAVIVAPGFGTARDIQRLAHDLGGTLPIEAVEAMMQAKGRGIRSRSRSAHSNKDDDRDGEEPSQTTTSSAAATTTTAATTITSNAWADFIKEEGVTFQSTTKGTTTSTTMVDSKKRSAKDSVNDKDHQEEEDDDDDDDDDDDGLEGAYDLQSLEKQLSVSLASSARKTKKSKSSSTTKSKNSNMATVSFGTLVQSGTLDATLLGRKNLPKLPATTTANDNPFPQHLTVPTVLLPTIAISKVFTSCNAAHCMALDRAHQLYGWGRNEQLQLGSTFGSNVSTPQILPTTSTATASSSSTMIVSAALGKSHSLLLQADGTILGLGSNKSGQCGWRASIKQSGTMKPSVVLSAAKNELNATTFCKIACGEDFSVALDDHGHLYTTGSSEFGQLANGETGEYFVTASKLAFANGYGWTRQTTFVDIMASDLSMSGGRSSSHTTGRATEDVKTAPIPACESIAFVDIACGKHHSIALEAPRKGKKNRSVPTRVFTWGSGNYGCLGHGRQQDEYFPRVVSAGLPPGMIATKVTCGTTCSLVLTNQGHVYYWGRHRSVGEATMRPQLVDALANNQHVVTLIGAGAQTVACCTNLGSTVVWGQGPYGELGLSDQKKSSAKPAFVESLNGIPILDLACGQGCMLYVVEKDDGLPVLDAQAVEELLRNTNNTSNTK